MVSIDESTVAIPGERLGSLEQFTPGNGTYIRHGYLFASLAGYKQVLQQQNGEVRMNITEWTLLLFGIVRSREWEPQSKLMFSPDR